LALLPKLLFELDRVVNVQLAEHRFLDIDLGNLVGNGQEIA